MAASDKTPQTATSVTKSTCSIYQQDIFERDIILDELQKMSHYAVQDEDQFRCRIRDLSTLQRKFLKIQCKIDLLKVGTFDKNEQLNIRNNFNDLFYGVQIYADKLKKK